MAEIPVLEFVVTHPGLKAYGISPEMAREKLLSVGFAVDDRRAPPPRFLPPAMDESNSSLPPFLPLAPSLLRLSTPRP